MSHARRARAVNAALALGALGMVFGDIGTSPLYAFRQCFLSSCKIAPTHENVLGILSLILWSLILIVFIRYIGMIMRVSHDGEGGILALLAFVLPPSKRGVLPAATWLTFLVILGAGMLFGDGIITPAVSVLSAVEGARWPRPRRSTSSYRSRSPSWSRSSSCRIAARGASATSSGRSCSYGSQRSRCSASPASCSILPCSGRSIRTTSSPSSSITGLAAIVIFGAVVLCVSGVEALYADMSHFGREADRRGVDTVVFPGARAQLRRPRCARARRSAALDNPFYASCRRHAVRGRRDRDAGDDHRDPGADLGGLHAHEASHQPRLHPAHARHLHVDRPSRPRSTSHRSTVCWPWPASRWSSRSRAPTALANAYGLAVAVTMIVTSIAYFEVVRTKFGWSSRATLSLRRFLGSSSVRRRQSARRCRRRVDPVRDQPSSS